MGKRRPAWKVVEEQVAMVVAASVREKSEERSSSLRCVRMPMPYTSAFMIRDDRFPGVKFVVNVERVGSRQS